VHPIYLRRAVTKVEIENGLAPKFITRQLVRAQALQAYKRLRKLAKLGDRPPDFP
jgi:hypothetical protein